MASLRIPKDHGSIRISRVRFLEFSWGLLTSQEAASFSFPALSSSSSSSSSSKQ